MSEKQFESQLKTTLQRLEVSAEKIVRTRGYTNEVEKMKILAELIKEQLRSENTRHSARQTR